MKSLVKRLGVLILTALMVVGMGMTALADSTTETTAKIQVSRVAIGDTIRAYRLISYTDDFNNYDISENFKDFLKTQKEDSTDLIGDLLPADKDSTDLSKLISDYMNWEENDLTNTPVYTANADTVSGKASGVEYGTAVFDGLAPGYYFLRGITSPENNIAYKPMTVFIKVNSEKLEVYGEGDPDPLDKGTDDYYELVAKSAKGPTVQKKVKNQNGEWADVTSASVGDTVDFCVSLGIPDYAEFNKVILKLEDTMSGMKYIDGSAKLYKDAELTQEISGGILSDSGTEGGKRTFEISYQQVDDQNAFLAYVTYSAKITADAAESSVASNKARLLYTLNTDTAYTAESRTKIFNYSVRISKKDENGNDLNGAEFSFYKDEACSDIISFESKTGADNKVSYYYPSETGTITALPANASFLVKGLSAGTVYMKEVTTPRGYYAPAGGMKITLVENTSVSGATGVLDSTSKMEAMNENDKGLLPTDFQHVDTEKLYQFEAAVKNTSTPLLPSTGGIGTGMFTAAGVVLMILGVYVFFFRKKEKRQ